MMEYAQYPANKCDGVSHFTGALPCHSLKIRSNLFILTQRFSTSRDVTPHFVETVRMQKTISTIALLGYCEPNYYKVGDVTFLHRVLYTFFYCFKI